MLILNVCTSGLIPKRNYITLHVALCLLLHKIPKLIAVLSHLEFLTLSVTIRWASQWFILTKNKQTNKKPTRGKKEREVDFRHSLMEHETYHDICNIHCLKLGNLDVNSAVSYLKGTLDSGLPYGLLSSKRPLKTSRRVICSSPWKFTLPRYLQFFMIITLLIGRQECFRRAIFRAHVEFLKRPVYGWLVLLQVILV